MLFTLSCGTPLYLRKHGFVEEINILLLKFIFGIDNVNNFFFKIVFSKKSLIRTNQIELCITLTFIYSNENTGVYFIPRSFS